MGWMRGSNMIDQLPGAPGFGNSGSGRMARWLVVLILVGVAVGLAKRGGLELAAEPPASFATSPPTVGWQGTWLQEGGPAVIRFAGDASLYSPDGIGLIGFRPVFRGDQATFQAYLRGVPWTLTLMRAGNGGRLVGVRDSRAMVMPMVIASGATGEERLAAATRRRQETRSMLVPTELGKFVKTEAIVSVDHEAANAGQDPRRESQ